MWAFLPALLWFRLTLGGKTDDLGLRNLLFRLMLPVVPLALAVSVCEAFTTAGTFCLIVGMNLLFLGACRLGGVWREE